MERGDVYSQDGACYLVLEEKAKNLVKVIIGKDMMMMDIIGYGIAAKSKLTYKVTNMPDELIGFFEYRIKNEC